MFNLNILEAGDKTANGRCSINVDGLRESIKCTVFTVYTRLSHALSCLDDFWYFHSGKESTSCESPLAVLCPFSTLPHGSRGIYLIGSLGRIIWTCSAQHSLPISFWEWPMHQASEVSSTPLAQALIWHSPLTCGGFPSPGWPGTEGVICLTLGCRRQAHLSLILFYFLAWLLSGLHLPCCFVFLLI